MKTRIGAATLIKRRAFIGGVLAAPLAGAALANTQDLAFDITSMQPGDFTWSPERSPHGPVAIVVSLPEQVAHV